MGFHPQSDLTPSLGKAISSVPLQCFSASQSAHLSSQMAMEVVWHADAHACAGAVKEFNIAFLKTTEH